MKSGAEAERVKAQGGAGRNVAGQGRVGQPIQPEALGKGRTRIVNVRLGRALMRNLIRADKSRGFWSPEFIRLASLVRLGRALTGNIIRAAKSLGISPEFIRLASPDQVKLIKAMVGESSQPETTGKGGTRRINVRLGRALKGNLIRAAKTRGISGAELLRRAILCEIGSLEAKKESSQPETAGKGQTRIVQVSLGRRLKEKLKFAAKSLGLSPSELLRRAILCEIGSLEAKTVKPGAQ